MYLLEKEVVCAWKLEEGQKERERGGEVDPLLRAEPDAGLHLTTLRSWSEPEAGVGGLNEWATGSPLLNLNEVVLNVFLWFLIHYRVTYWVGFFLLLYFQSLGSKDVRSTFYI